jgi:hypothetical protein
MPSLVPPPLPTPPFAARTHSGAKTIEKTKRHAAANDKIPFIEKPPLNVEISKQKSKSRICA